MSVDALNWAFNKQRLKDPESHLILIALAWASDPTGLAFGWRRDRRHWVKWLELRTGLSRATIFRRIGDLKDVGLLDPQMIIHEDGTKQWVVQLDLSRVAWWEREAKVYRLHTLSERLEPDDGDEAATLAAGDDLAMQADFQSQAETQNLARGVFRPSTESQAETRPVDIGPGESLPETERVSLLRLQESQTVESVKERIPQTPSDAAGGQAAGRREQAERPALAPIGFALFRQNYPQGDVISERVWSRAADEYARLSEGERAKVNENVMRYAERIRNHNRRAINPDRWIKEREFERYSAVALVGVATPHAFVVEGTEPWEAWCNVLACAYGDPSSIPRSYQATGPKRERGLNVPAPWPVGGTGWLVNHHDWTFVEKYTPQFNRFNERVVEILGRGMMVIRASSVAVKPHHKRIGRGPEGTLSEPTCFGALVPSITGFPPAKGEGHGNLQPSDALAAQIKAAS